ncbi:MAG: hypothetical protein UU76_C0013G0004 [Parcubacteria group bacterium GW2011_GWC1_41_7]|nr:MAG: hypothetical protein UU76_C0013G0004 [Parcubacteria group bacterium GW2011_GWC1_41_7]
MDTTQFLEKLEKEKTDLELLLKELEKDTEDAKSNSDEASTEISDSSDQYEAMQGIFSKKEVVKKRLDKIAYALQRIKENTYGTCKKCGKAIEELRLKIDPAMTTCRDCSEK